MTEEADPQGGPVQAVAWPLWKKLSFVLATGLILTGAGIQAKVALMGPQARTAVASPTAPAGSRATQSSSMHAGSSSLVGGGGAGLAPAGGSLTGVSTARPGGEAQVEKPSIAERASPFLIESGASFFVGYCIAAALRALAKTLAIVVGFFLLAYFGLQQAGVVPPLDLSGLEQWLTRAAEGAETVMHKIQAWMAHGLPSGTMGGLGLASGFKRT